MLNVLSSVMTDYCWCCLPAEDDTADREYPHQRCTAEQTLSEGLVGVDRETLPASAAMGTPSSLAANTDRQTQVSVKLNSL